MQTVEINIKTEMTDAYLSGSDLDRYRDSWFFFLFSEKKNQSCFTAPPMDEATKEIVRMLRDRIIQEAKQFRPVNPDIWDFLFPGWETALPEIDLIVGFPPYYDAVTEYDPQGKIHILFDLVCWKSYANKENLRQIIRNLVTHEITHVLIERYYPEIAQAQAGSAYGPRLNALTVHEGFAHLLAFEGVRIDQVNWEDDRLRQAYDSGLELLRKAQAQTDREKQEEALVKGFCGPFYDKYACMCGMMYLADTWKREGKDGLKKELDHFEGFIDRILA